MRATALVHDDPAFCGRARDLLERAGCEVAIFPDPMVAINAIEASEPFDTLITRVRFSPGQPTGVSLALILRTRYPGMNVVFVGAPENRPHTQGIGTLIPHPVDLARLLQALRVLPPRERSLHLLGVATPALQALAAAPGAVG